MELMEFNVIRKQSVSHWKEGVYRKFTVKDKRHTTILCSGLTLAHDTFIEAALSGLGYKMQALDCPDGHALTLGKEYGNRGQCNPTYFTVGNLIKYLKYLCDEKGMSSEEIVRKYAFITAGACGPCRFGMYVTEFRKALRDSGFEGFRVLLFDAGGGVEQSGDSGLRFDRAFFTALLKAVFAADILNSIKCRIRPYETAKGSTNLCFQQCREIIIDALKSQRSLLRALYRCRKKIMKIKVDRSQIKPKVIITGEFWAMTTEGEGSYYLPQYLEDEGAEVDVQPIVNWILYNLWQAKVDTKRRMLLRGSDLMARKGLKTSKIAKRLFLIWFGRQAIKTVYYVFCKTIGLKNYHLPDVEENAHLAHRYYNNDLRGGEGHMEVGKVLQSILHRKAHMVISIKPFGCMPSSGVSDGIQSAVLEKYPEAIFLPIETTGDGAVNVYSRVQMMLFKAKQAAIVEYEKILKKKKISKNQAQEKIRSKYRKRSAIHYARHRFAGTAANSLLEAL